MKIDNIVKQIMMTNQLNANANNLALKNISHIIDSLFPSTSNSLFDNLNNLLFPDQNKNTIASFLSSLSSFQDTYAQQGMIYVKGAARETNEYGHYLQANDPRMRELAYSIVDKTDSNDEKMYKIEQWVIENFTYEFDNITYGQDEYWATPDESLRKMQGDCEDGAWLIHSLALNADVPSDRLRTYGGVVAWQNEQGGLSAGGHAWTAYQRESDNEWVILDWCFFNTDAPLDNRITMSNNMKYVDDYFFVNLKNTVDTPYSNGIRNPEIHQGYGDPRLKGNIFDWFV